MIAETGVGEIDLLKIDAEKSELAILKGIEENDWPKIRQIVVEVHSTETLNILLPMLERKGFEIKVERESALASSEICNCFAVRAGVLAEPAEN